MLNEQKNDVEVKSVGLSFSGLMFEPTLILSQNNHHQVLLGRCTNYRQKWDLCQPRKKKLWYECLYTSKSRLWPRQNFSLHYQYNIKQTSNENKEKYQLLVEPIPNSPNYIIWIVRQKVRRITDEILGVKGLRQILAPSHQFFGSLVSKLKNSCWHWKRKSKAKQRKFSLERKFCLFFCYFPFVLSGCYQYAFSQNSRPCSLDLCLNVLTEVYWISCKCDNTEKIAHNCFS